MNFPAKIGIYLLKGVPYRYDNNTEGPSSHFEGTASHFPLEIKA